MKKSVVVILAVTAFIALGAVPAFAQQYTATINLVNKSPQPLNVALIYGFNWGSGVEPCKHGWWSVAAYSTRTITLNMAGTVNGGIGFYANTNGAYWNGQGNYKGALGSYWVTGNSFGPDPLAQGYRGQYAVPFGMIPVQGSLTGTHTITFDW